MKDEKILHLDVADVTTIFIIDVVSFKLIKSNYICHLKNDATSVKIS